MDKKKKSALYVRVSTTHQVDKDSLPLQRSDLTNYTKYVLGINDFEIFEDAGYSGGTTDRPAYQDMMNRIKMGEFTHLIVWKIDRISRNLRDFSDMYDELKKYNVTFISRNEQFDTSTAMGEAMLKIILVFAELERKLTGERVFSVMISRAQKGLWNGATVPLGYEWDPETKFPRPCDNEAKIVQYIFDQYEEIKSTTKVAKKLNIENIPTKRNGTWTPRTVGSILTNPFYIGTYRYNTKTKKTRRWKDKSEWVVVENNHQAIINTEQFERVSQIIQNNYKGDKNYQRTNNKVHILSGIASCHKCGKKMHSGLDRARKVGFTPSRYTCYAFNINYTCANYSSDLAILPGLINYIANYMTLQERITSNHSLRDMESILLRGKYFEDIEHIEKQDLKNTYNLLINNTLVTYNSLEDEKKESIVSQNAIYEAEKEKYIKALKRLDDLYLYDVNSMSQKDFVIKRKEIADKIENVNKKIQEVKLNDTPFINNTDFNVLSKASFYLLTKNLSSVKNIDVISLLNNLDKQTIKDFINTIIADVSVERGKIYNITFKNGIVHHFIYKNK